MTSFWIAVSSKESREKLALWEDGLKKRAREDASQMRSLSVKLDQETTKVLTAFGNTIIIRMLGTGRILERLLSGERKEGKKAE
jgi:hypothetical protein